jgi:hypothetical protein
MKTYYDRFQVVETDYDRVKHRELGNNYKYYRKVVLAGLTSNYKSDVSSINPVYYGNPSKYEWSFL